MHDHVLPPGSAWRTREEARLQIPVFWLDDGHPVYEVWFWHATVRRWFCMSHAGPAIHQGVGYFRTVAQLKAQIAYFAGLAPAPDAQ